MAKLAKKKTKTATTTKKSTTKIATKSKSSQVKKAKTAIKKTVQKKPSTVVAKPSVVVPPATVLPTTPVSNKKRVLIVDDEADIRSTLKTLLEKEGFYVDTVQNAEECLQKTSKETYNLILLDIMMPGIPVKTVVEKVTTIPIAFLSVVRTSEEEQKALLARPNVKAFIQKPFNIKELANTVKKLTA